MLILRPRMAACVQSLFSMQRATCARMNSVFSRRSMEPNVSTCSSHRMSMAAFLSPCSFLMSDRMRVTRARSTSTKILPSVTVRSVSMTESLVSMFGVSSRNFMTVWTMRVTACLSWPCFLESTSTWSLSKLHFPASLQMVHIAMRMRDVEARSDACWGQQAGARRRVWFGRKLTWRVCFSSNASFSMAVVTSF